jgi:hypothetical protein
MYTTSVIALFWRLPIWGGSQNRDYIKNHNIPWLTEEHTALYSLVKRGIYGHVAEACGGSQYLPRLRVTEEYITLYS